MLEQILLSSPTAFIFVLSPGQVDSVRHCQLVFLTSVLDVGLFQLLALAFVSWPLLAIWVDPLLTSNSCLGTGGSVLPAVQPHFRAGSLASSKSQWESAKSSIQSLAREQGQGFLTG